MMMKSINDSNNNSNSNISNWLGFSLSHNNKMEVTNANASSFSNSSVPTSFFPDSDVNFSSGFHPTSHLNVIMPIKSDVPLCIMEALTKSQSQASSSPKLENFLGGETEALPLSLNSIYYQQINAAEQEQQHFYPFYYSNGEQPRESTSFLTGFSADQISPMPNWVARSYSTQQVIEHQHMENADFTAATDQISPTEVNCLAMETKKRGPGIVGPKKIAHRKSIDTFGQRTSQYRGVTKHRWTGRYEAHLWDNSCKKEGQTRKGRQVYLGGYDMEEKAARAYDLAALKYWGPSTHINFPLENYKDGLEEMKNMTRQEFVAHLRRRSSGFSRGASMYRGVTRHHQHGRWQARIGRVAGNKDLYLGTFSTQEEAAEAYDIAAIKFRGTNAVTNFDITRYDVDKIISSNTLLAGDQAKRFKAIDHCPASQQINVESNYSSCDWKMSSNAFPQQQQQQQQQRALGNHKQEDIIGVGNYQGSNFLQDLIGTNSLSSATGHDQSELNKIGSIQLSNASSIVTSLNSSREGSPAEKSGSSASNVVLFPKAPVSWISPASAHFPVFAAWGDA